MSTTTRSYLPVERVLDCCPAVSERYYEARFYRNRHRKDSDQCVLLHSNRVCLVTLSPEHAIIKHNKTIDKIDFQIADNTNRLDNKVKGKWKKGGQRVEPHSMLCRVHCGQQTFDVLACIQGTIIEINERLTSEFDLLKEKTWSDGYVAIILPFLSQYTAQRESLLTVEQYQATLQELNQEIQS